MPHADRPTRRVALRTMLALPFVPLPSFAGNCVCKTLTDCTCEGPAATGEGGGEYARQQAKELAQVKAGGLYTKQTSSVSNYDREILEMERAAAKPPPKKRGAKDDAPARAEVNLELKRATGVSSQEFGESGSEAKEKFAALVRSKVAEREKLLGFELDADDIK
eukprot:CAMPEP_0118815520 /NCGR_PEP_ID=MMETSP1162-20130426/4241_1 /TAXON_ID=33656 /ORGANISM="Phaeocystis Sp, Strain CCMP2710" /LENGTH=163 /DNA_ID=CAMNT_0006745497 /DNA_START=11 /DNA_END=499 /DNA_ORIENTATION=+